MVPGDSNTGEATTLAAGMARRIPTSQAGDTTKKLVIHTLSNLRASLPTEDDKSRGAMIIDTTNLRREGVVVTVSSIKETIVEQGVTQHQSEATM